MLSIINNSVVMTPFSVYSILYVFVLDRQLYICNVSYHFKVKCGANAFLKPVYAFSRGTVRKLLNSLFGTDELLEN